MFPKFQIDPILDKIGKKYYALKIVYLLSKLYIADEINI